MCDHGDTVAVLVEVPADLSFTGQSRQKMAQIDRCIAPIVAALNAAGIKTRTCCCGHGKRDGEIVLQDGRTLVVKGFSISQEEEK